MCVLSLEQVCEKQKLLTERNQLKACMGELWENFSFLSQEVCREEKLSPEPSCPLFDRRSSPSPVRIDLTMSSSPSSSDLTLPPHHSLPPALSPAETPHPDQACPDRPLPAPRHPTETPLLTSSPTLTVALCQEMTDKCTTDE